MPDDLEIMKAWGWRAYGSYEGLKLETRPRPRPGPGEVLLRVRATSLNQRDLMAGRGELSRGLAANGIVPLCDGAGDIVEIGEGVRNLAGGDRVIGVFYPLWQSGPLRSAYTGYTRGSDIDGFLAEYVALPENALLRFPDHLSYAEAATLPCAAVTAWSALFTKSDLQPGETALVLGSGGVALFALQLAKAAGARVIMTTSSDARGERLRQLGADGIVDYRQVGWPQQVIALSGGGANVIVENGGAASYGQSLQAAALNGRLAIVGLMTGAADPGGSFATIFFRNLTVKAVQVGTCIATEALLRFIGTAKIKPIIDSRYRFEDARAAYLRLASGQAFGKVVIEIGDDEAD